MIKGKNVLVIIPCRSGSKGIRNKNILKLNGVPLINYSIFFAKKLKFVDKILVTTDSKRYQKIINFQGNFSPYLRPKKISKDLSLDIDFIKHGLNWLKKNENFNPYFIVHLRPTSPLRKLQDVENAIKKIANDSSIDSVRSVSKLNKPIEKIWYKNPKGILKQVAKQKRKFKEPFNAPRQSLTQVYSQNALFDVYKSDNIRKNNLLSGKKIFGYLTKESLDIDNMNDFKICKKKIKSVKSYLRFIG